MGYLWLGERNSDFERVCTFSAGASSPIGLHVVGLQQGTMTSFLWQGKQDTYALSWLLAHAIALPLTCVPSGPLLGFLSPYPGAWPGLHVHPAQLMKSCGHIPLCCVAEAKSWVTQGFMGFCLYSEMDIDPLV